MPNDDLGKKIQAGEDFLKKPSVNQLSGSGLLVSDRRLPTKRSGGQRRGRGRERIAAESAGFPHSAPARIRILPTITCSESRTNTPATLTKRGLHLKNAPR